MKHWPAIFLAALICAAAPGAWAKPDCRPTAEAPHLAYAILFFLPDSTVLAPGQRGEIDRLAERARANPVRRQGTADPQAPRGQEQPRRNHRRIGLRRHKSCFARTFSG